MPAASSIIERRSKGLADSACPMRPCSMIALFDDRVVRRAQSRAREKVLNVPQAAAAAIHLVFALACAIKAAPDGDPLAGLKDSRRAFRLNLSEREAARLLPL
jgi:hypothetical protein